MVELCPGSCRRHFDAYDLSVDVSQAKREVVFWKVGRTAPGESRPSMQKKLPDHSVEVAHFANGRLFQRKRSVNQKTVIVPIEFVSMEGIRKSSGSGRWSA